MTALNPNLIVIGVVLLAALCIAIHGKGSYEFTMNVLKGLLTFKKKR